MWTVENRARYDRSKLRYLGNLVDAKWADQLLRIVDLQNRRSARRSASQQETAGA